MGWKEGGLLAGGALAGSNLAMGITGSGLADSTILPIAVALVVEGILLDQLMFAEKKYDKLFKLCGIENKDKKLPIIIKKTKKDKETTLVLHLPEGLSQKHFEQKQEELEQNLNGKIEFAFNKNLIMKIIHNNLKSNYPYIFEGCEGLKVYCGETHQGKFCLDIEKTPHVIVAGETGSGKSSLLRNMVLSLILNSNNIDIHLIDFQAVELGIFEDCKKVKSYGEKPADFEELMNDLEDENKKRLKMFRSVKNKTYIQNLGAWNKKYPERKLPYKVVIIDEFARLAEKEYDGLLEQFRTRVSMDRKVGIHYIVSMQRPDVKCISGSIKANMPTRIAFKTFSQVDSEVILDTRGAEKIKEKGRFLIKYCGELKEVQALYIGNDKVRSFLKKHKKYKSKNELQKDKKERMKKLRDKCINPYLGKFE